jgi:hypothetical protein
LTRVTRTNVNKSTVTDIALASSPNEDIALASSQPTATADPNSSAQHGLPPAALAGVVLAGVALVALSGAIMWLVQRRERKTGVPSPLSRASMAARRASVRVKQRASHVKIESKEYLGSGLSDVHEGA